MASKNEYRIEYAPLVFDDLDGIVTYISEELQAPENAERLLNRIDAAMKALNEYPYKMPLVRDRILASKGYHALQVNEYRVFYVIEEDRKTVSIRRVIYGKRDYKELLS